jgi:thiamine-phosphate pyrophosphorylase
VGINILKELKSELAIPFYALGGVMSGNIVQVVSAGATGVAMISAIMAAEDIKKASSKVIEAIAFIDKVICNSCIPRY